MSKVGDEIGNDSIDKALNGSLYTNIPQVLVYRP